MIKHLISKRRCRSTLGHIIIHILLKEVNNFLRNTQLFFDIASISIVHYIEETSLLLHQQTFIFLFLSKKILTHHLVSIFQSVYFKNYSALIKEKSASSFFVINNKPSPMGKIVEIKAG